MQKIRAFIRHWFTVARMGSEELAAMTLPPWLLTVLHVRNEVKQDYIGLIAAGVAFYFLLAAFPALAALVSIFGLFADPYVITQEIDAMSAFLPQEALSILTSQVTTLAQSPNRALSVSLIISILLAMYSATRGMQALIKGFNIAYNARETRGMVRLTLLSYGLTFLMLLAFIISLALIAGLPAALQIFDLPEGVTATGQWLRWPLLFTMGLIGIETLYTLGPCRKRRDLRVSPGAVAATLLWIGGSSLFSLFVSNFSNFNETYGSLGAVVVLLLWFWVSALTILMGAEVNGTLEKNRASKQDAVSA